MPLNPVSIPDPAVEPAVRGSDAPARSALVAALAERLREGGIRHCLWKGFEKPERIATGGGDLDLLVDRAHAGATARLLIASGMKEARAVPDRQVDGVTSWLGHDAGLGRLIHVHFHYRIVIGRAWETHYDLPCAPAVLERAVAGPLFPQPDAELAWILFVLRQTMNHRPADLRGGAPWLNALQPARARLLAATDRVGVLRTLSDALPDVRRRVFDRCVAALEPRCPPRERLRARRDLEGELAAGAMRPGLVSTLRRAGGAALALVRRRPAWAHPRKRPAAGGIVFALVGTDGSGKSTCASSLLQWLGAELETMHAHLGRPPRGLPTLAAGGLLKAGRMLHRAAPRVFGANALAHLELLRALATGRDRYRLYRRVRRFALAGGVAVCERYPIAEDRALVGPSGSQGIALDARGVLAWLLRKAEWRYYAHLLRPDHIVVLAVDPDTAVRRKTTEPSDYVRARAERLWRAEWPDEACDVLDATRPLEAVLADVKARLWRLL